MSGEVKNYVGQRLSFNSSLCTVRYVGSVEGTKGSWLGVEWDDPQAGKHNGSHNSIEYFKCRSGSATAASFVRPTRPVDKPVSFLHALRSKYQDEDPDDNIETVFISGKEAEEIGFDKIKREQAQLQALRDVLLDGQRVTGLKNIPWTASNSLVIFEEAVQQISTTCPRIRQLDLSQNLIETLVDVAAICKGLPSLKTLTLNGSRLHDLTIPDHLLTFTFEAFGSIIDLSLNNCLMTWEEIAKLTGFFSNLRTLYASGNNLPSVTEPLMTPSLRVLHLAHNGFHSFMQLEMLLQLRELRELSVLGNKFESVDPSPTFSTLENLDISSNLLPTLSSLNTVPIHFPSLISLRISNNPFFVALAADDAYMLSLARIPSIKILNFSNITPKDRENAELYYLSRIAGELGAVPEQQFETVAKLHPLWELLCKKYGQPVIKRNDSKTNPGTLGARLIRIGVRQRGDDDIDHIKWIKISKYMNVYMLKSLIGEMFALLPTEFKVLWETGEWDPVGTERFSKDDEARFEVAEAFVEDSEGLRSDDSELERQGRWVRREVELVEGTTSIGYWIEGKEAFVKLERLR